jgi:hypothetical protein
MKKEMEKREN